MFTTARSKLILLIATLLATLSIYGGGVALQDTATPEAKPGASPVATPASPVASPVG
jgi:hypothetical protein